ncbi:MAG: (Fe-S)-binding protein [Desulfobacterales bacterium]
MQTALISPAKATFIGIPTALFSLIIPVIGVAIFTYIIAKRLAPLIRALSDERMDHPAKRLAGLFKYAIGQYKQPRYMLAGIIHIIFFAGFIIISLRSITLVLLGISEGYHLPGLGGDVGTTYNMVKDVTAAVLLLACIVAMVRRGFFKPERYAVPPKYGKDHTPEAIFVLVLISGLLISDALFEGSLASAQIQNNLSPEWMVPGTIPWMAADVLSSVSIESLQHIHIGAYFSHELIFFFFLCFLPLGKHFHIITSFPNVFMMKLEKGTVKPVRWRVPDNELDEIKNFGVKKFEDFTWKHMLDFYTCADCGRCSDQCPANAVGRPLSPRFISIKCRDYAFRHYPLRGEFQITDEPLIGGILEEHEIWSCTTCGACEEECPVMIEYIDKIVDLRRYMVDEGMVPQSLQKPLGALEKRGNPFGKMERKRADWIKDKDFAESCRIKVAGGKEKVETLYFVDSITSFDDRIQNIARSTALILKAAGIDFGILGPSEMDSGHEVRRFGEEMLYQQLRDKNIRAISACGAKKLITADPHAYNALKKDYHGLPEIEHISQIIARALSSGEMTLKPIEEKDKVFTYHDPCYLGRHNGLYDIPRKVIDSIGDIKRVEMEKCKDRSFCCGGGGLYLFYEPIEEKRMGQVRVEMAAKAGADVIITACPFCMVNLEDAVKTSGLEGKMEIIDLAELVVRQLSK